MKKEEEMGHYKKKRRAQQRFRSSPLENLGIRGTNSFRIGNWKLFVDSMGSEEGPVMCDRNERIIVLNDEHPYCETIRKTYPEKLQSVHYAHLISVGLTFGQNLSKGWDYERYYHEKLSRVGSSILLRYLHEKKRTQRFRS